MEHLSLRQLEHLKKARQELARMEKCQPVDLMSIQFFAAKATAYYAAFLAENAWSQNPDSDFIDLDKL